MLTCASLSAAAVEVIGGQVATKQSTPRSLHTNQDIVARLLADSSIVPQQCCQMGKNRCQQLHRSSPACCSVNPARAAKIALKKATFHHPEQRTTLLLPLLQSIPMCSCRTPDKVF
jgi:hypothetical protein